MDKVIKHLEKLREDYEATKRTHEADLKLGKKGIRRYFDPVYYDEEGHNEVIKAIEILKQHP